MNGITIGKTVFAILALASAGLPCLADDGGASPNKIAADYLLESSVIGSAGGAGGSTQFLLNGTMAQPSPVGSGSSGGFLVGGGFWSKLQTYTNVLEEVIPPFFRNALLPNRPNPFNPITSIHFEVSRESPVEINIYNLQGRLVRTLLREVKGPGRYVLTWDGRDDRGRALASGIFFCQYQVGSYGDVRKMILLK